MYGSVLTVLAEGSPVARGTDAVPVDAVLRLQRVLRHGAAPVSAHLVVNVAIKRCEETSPVTRG